MLAHAVLVLCTHGSATHWAKPGAVPPQAATAIVEITSDSRVEHAAITAFDLVGSNGTAKMQRITAAGQYSQRDGTLQPWDGSLPKGTIRLRIDAAMSDAAFSVGLGTCRVTIGPYTVQGRIGREWPNG